MAKNTIVRKCEPFLSILTIKWIAMLLMGATLTSSALFYVDIFCLGITDVNSVIIFFKNLGSVAIPLFMLYALVNLFQKKQQILHICLTYFILGLLFYLLEIFAFEFVILDFFHYIAQSVTTLPVDSIIDDLSEVLFTAFGNINIFVDMFVCSLFFLFLYCNPFKLKNKRLIVFRLGAIIPTAYIIISFVLTGLFNCAIIELTFHTAALFASRPVYAYVFYLGLLAYLMYTEPTRAHIKNLLDDGRPRASRQFALLGVILVLIICLCESAFSTIPVLTYFGLGKGTKLYFIAPFVLFTNYKIIPKHKWLGILSTVYYAALCFVMFVLYSMLIVFFLELLGVTL